MKKVLFDTDIGSDIDDAVCLAYLLAQPDCELLGITTVSGEPVRRAQIASAMCLAAGRQIPVYPGEADPLQGAQLQPAAPQAAALDAWPHDSDFPEGQAVSFLRDTIRAHPGEVTLLAVGPMTNVARLFTAEPGIGAELGALVLMGGVFLAEDPLQKNTEWNIKCDPRAGAAVYGEPVAVHRSIGLDVTRHVSMAAAEVRARFNVPALKPVLDFAEVWFQQRETLTFHDPLAGAALFNDDLCTYQSGSVSVETADQTRMGATDWTPGADGSPHEVAATVDADAFFTEYFSVFAPQREDPSSA